MPTQSGLECNSMSWYGMKSFVSSLIFSTLQNELIRHTGLTQSPTEKNLPVEQFIHNDSADDFDDK